MHRHLNLVCNDRGNLVPFTSHLSGDGKDKFNEYCSQDGILFVNSRVTMAGIADGTSTILLCSEQPPSNDLYFGWM